MNLARNNNKKSSFDLSKFYQDLSRVQNSLGKSAPRNSTNSLAKNNQNNQIHERVQNLQSFKKDINNKNLLKSKIQIQKNNDRPKVNKTEYEEKNSESRIYRLSQLQKPECEESLENVRRKLEMWNSFGKVDKEQKIEDLQPSHSKTANNSKLYYATKTANIYEQLEASTQIPAANTQNEQHLASTINNELLLQLQRRDRVYKLVEKEIKVEKSYYKKQYNDLSVKLKQNFREADLMKEIIERFKQICGLKIEDLGKLHDLLRSNSMDSREEAKPFSRDSSILSNK